MFCERTNESEKLKNKTHNSQNNSHLDKLKSFLKMNGIFLPFLLLFCVALILKIQKKNDNEEEKKGISFRCDTRNSQYLAVPAYGSCSRMGM